MITRQLNNVNRLIDWTDEINNIDSSFGFIVNSGLFNEKTTSQDAVMFEKSDYNTVLARTTSRRERNTQKQGARTSKMYALALPYVNVQDKVVREDLQGYVQRGTEITPETEGAVIAEKMEKMRLTYDQTREFMALSAVKGLSVDADGNVIADMFDQFGLTQEVITWTLSDPNFDVIKACRELKTKLTKDLRTGGTIRAIEIMVGVEFFDALVSHPQVVAAHYAYAMPERAFYMDGGATYQQFGVQNVFAFQGITFMTYDATFSIDQGDGTFDVVDAVDPEEGHTLIRGVNDLFRVYYGTNNKLSGVNQQGAPVYMHSYRDGRDYGIDLEMEFSHLYFGTQPQTQKKLVLA